mmetsp:Transcript_34332/g.80101  ORF Transcript_34332/g.80101 Transcript_34332/m.80101 type:complete len:250 (+) Transcript_34332:455-1204(+)
MLGQSWWRAPSPPDKGAQALGTSTHSFPLEHPRHTRIWHRQSHTAERAQKEGKREENDRETAQAVGEKVTPSPTAGMHSRRGFAAATSHMVPTSALHGRRSKLHRRSDCPVSRQQERGHLHAARACFSRHLESSLLRAKGSSHPHHHLGICLLDHAASPVSPIPSSRGICRQIYQIRSRHLSPGPFRYGCDPCPRHIGLRSTRRSRPMRRQIRRHLLWNRSHSSSRWRQKHPGPPLAERHNTLLATVPI